MIAIALALSSPRHCAAETKQQTGHWTSTYSTIGNNEPVHMIHLRGPADSSTILLVGKGLQSEIQWNFKAQSSLSTPSFTRQKLPTSAGNPFCAGHCLLSDGRALVVSGTIHGETGSRVATVFDVTRANDDRWIPQATLAAGRWYPTLVSTALGTAFSIAGGRWNWMPQLAGRDSSGPSNQLRPLAIGEPGVWKAAAVTGTPPSAREDAAITWAAKIVWSRRSVMFGGDSNGDSADGKLGDVWFALRSFFTDTTYKWLSPTVYGGPAPTRRRAHTLTLSPEDTVAVDTTLIPNPVGGAAYVFGGQGPGGGALGGVWRMAIGAPNGSNASDSNVVGTIRWDSLAISGPKPAARWDHSAVFDPGKDKAKPRILIFGGTNGSQVFSDYWALNLLVGGSGAYSWDSLGVGSRALRQQTAVSDIGEAGVTDDHDAAEPLPPGAPRVNIYIYGGKDSSGALRSEVYALSRYDTESSETWAWSTISTSAGVPADGSPAARANHTAIYDYLWLRMLISGGEKVSGGSSQLTSETWTLDLHPDAGTQYKWFKFPTIADGQGAVGRARHSALFDVPTEEAVWPESFDPTAGGSSPGSWTTWPDAGRKTLRYPFVFQMPTAAGKSYSRSLFFAGPRREQYSRYALDLTTRTWGSNTLSDTMSWIGSAVMYRPGRILRCGAISGGVGQPAKEWSDILKVDDSTHVDSLAWLRIGDMTRPRANHNLVMLPTGDVLALGGCYPDTTLPASKPQVWKPGSHDWADSLAADSAVRNYHSSAVLLSDGRILSGGGDNYLYGRTVNIFEPPYLYSGDDYATRPALETVFRRASYGETFTACTQYLTGIRQAALIRPGAATHAFNQDQRYVPLKIRSVASDSSYYMFDAPADSFEAPPGDYLLFLLNNKGVPSVGSWVRLGSPLLPDALPPHQTPDFVATFVTNNSIQLAWIVPPDSFRVSFVDTFALKRSSAAITNDSQFSSAATVSSPPVSCCPHRYVYKAVTGLYGCTTYWFAVKSRDASGNWSQLARLDSITTLCEGGGGDLSAGRVDARGAGALSARSSTSSAVGASQTPFEPRVVVLESQPVATGLSLRAWVETADAGLSEAPDSAAIELQVRQPDGAWRTSEGFERGDWSRIGVFAPRPGTRLVLRGRFAIDAVSTRVVEASGQELATNSIVHSRLGSLTEESLAGLDLDAELQPGDTLSAEFGSAGTGATEATAITFLLSGPAAPAATSAHASPAPASGEGPVRFALHPNRPNPFGSTTTFRFDVPRRARVGLEVFDVAGRRVATVVDRVIEPGFHSLEWPALSRNGRHLQPGLYIYRMTAAEFSARRKLVITP